MAPALTAWQTPWQPRPSHRALPGDAILAPEDMDEMTALQIARVSAQVPCLPGIGLASLWTIAQ